MCVSLPHIKKPARKSPGNATLQQFHMIAAMSSEPLDTEIKCLVRRYSEKTS